MTEGRSWDAPPLTALDLAAGMPLGAAEATPAGEGPPLPPARSLETVLADALQRPPCLVSFSGGRDSSALLAVATRVARRLDLPLPIPATLQFPGSAEADEDDWQALVLKHLAVQDWHRHRVEESSFDAVGPIASEMLLRHGLLWPFNTHFHQPLVAAAAGGSLITGFGGDEVGRSSAGARAGRALAMRRRPALTDPLVIGLALAPRPIRLAVHRRRERAAVVGMPWLTESGARLVLGAFAEMEASIHLSWARTLTQWFPTRRYFSVCQESFRILGEDHDVSIVHPFVHPEVLRSLASAGGIGGFGTRTELMNALFADALPPSVIQRQTKGTFTAPFWTDTARSFAREWSGEGMPVEYVDGARLREHWADEGVNLLSAPMLQAAWLFDRTGRRSFID